MSNKELISIAKTLDISDKNESLYRFACGLLENCLDLEKGSEKGINMFFASVKNIKSNCRSGQVSDGSLNHALGNLGKKGFIVSNWCKLILENAQLQKLTSEELQYVMAAAARLCKISEKRKEEAPSQSAVPKKYVSENKPEPKKPTEFFCSKCKAKLEPTEKQMSLAGKNFIPINCKECGKQNRI